MQQYPKPPLPRQHQPMPGRTDKMLPKPDHGEESYHGSGKLAGKKAVITGADSGIGRAVAIAYAREGADVLIAYLNEHEDAKETQRLVEEAGARRSWSRAISDRPRIAARSSTRRSHSLAASTFSSTTRRTRRPSNRSRISLTRNGNSPSGSTSTRCST